MNHVLVARHPKLGRGHSFRESGLFTAESISVDLVLTILGVSLAAFWNWNPWLIFAALAPLVVVHRSLSVPQLQAEARVDPKTGLYNARYFATTLAAEIARAARFERPMSLIMADLDLLRDINNSYGHLAGDAVLKGIAEIFHQELRHYDVPARFGGEEFSILLPETPPEQAMEIAERIRRAVAEREFEVETAAEPIRATVSLGVAGFPKDGLDANELIHQADLAVYRGKLQGRNRVVGASTEPLLMASERGAKLRAVVEDGEHIAPLPPGRADRAGRGARATPKPRTLHGPTFFQLSTRLALVVASVSVHRHRRRRGRPHLGPEHRLRRPARRARARRRGAGALVRARRGRGLAVGQRRRLARRRGALRLSRRAAARGHDRRRRLERAAQLAAHGRLQHRHDGAVVARGGIASSRSGPGTGNAGRLVVAAHRARSAAPCTSSSTWAC